MITTPQGFDLQGQEPLEGKSVQVDAASRVAITTATKYDGLTVYQVDTNKNWQWHGTPAAGAWVEEVRDGYSTSSFINVSAGVGDAGKPIILDATGKIDLTMLSASDLSLYYLLDGTRPLTGVMDAGTNKLSNIAVGSVSGDAVAFQQLSDYLLITGTAADSSLLGGNNAAYYLNASNINAGVIGDAYLPATITSDITGNANTANSSAQWTTQRLLTLQGDVSGSVFVQGNSNMVMTTIVADDSHSHTDATIDVGFNTVKINIGTWNMQSFPGKTVDITSLSIPLGNIISITAYIFPNGVTSAALNLEASFIGTQASGDTGLFGGNVTIPLINNLVNLYRVIGGYFQSTSYNDTITNRGWLTIIYS